MGFPVLFIDNPVDITCCIYYMLFNINSYKVKRLLISGDYVCTDIDNNYFLLCKALRKPSFHNVRIYGIVLPIEYVYLHDNEPYGCFPLHASMQHCLTKARYLVGGALTKNLPYVFWQLASLVVNASNDKTLRTELVSCLSVDNLWLEQDQVQLIWNPKQYHGRYSEEAAVSQLIKLLFLVNYGRDKDEERLIGLKQTECSNMLHRIMTNKMTLMEIAHECKLINEMTPKKWINTTMRYRRFSEARNGRRKLKKYQPKGRLHRSPKKADSISFDNVYRYAYSYKIYYSIKASTLFRNRRRTSTVDYNTLAVPQRIDDITSLVRLRALEAFYKEKKHSVTASVEQHDETIRTHLSRYKYRSIEHMYTVRRYRRETVVLSSKDNNIAELISQSSQLKQVAQWPRQYSRYEPKREEFYDSYYSIYESTTNQPQIKHNVSNIRVNYQQHIYIRYYTKEVQAEVIPQKVEHKPIEKQPIKYPYKIEKVVKQEIKKESTPEPKRIKYPEKQEKPKMPEVVKNVVDSPMSEFDDIPQIKTVEKQPTEKPKEKTKNKPEPKTYSPKPAIIKQKAEPPSRQKVEDYDDLYEISLAKQKYPPKPPKYPPKQKYPSKYNLKTYTSQTSEKRNNNIQYQIEEYISFINLMGEAVGKSQKTIKTVPGLDTKIDWFTGVFYLYKRFLRERKKIYNCIYNGINKLYRKGKYIDQAAFEKWLKSPTRSTLLATIKRDNAEIEKAITRMHQTLVKKHGSNQRIVKHADLSKESEEESFIAIEYVLSYCDDILEMDDVMTPELMAHIVYIIDALYIMAEMDDKIVIKVDVKERKQLKKFEDYFERQYAHIGQLRRIYGI